jgi:DNA-nicking Smr family endonuclease
MHALGDIQRELRDQARRDQVQQQTRARLQRVSAKQNDLFLRAIGAVVPLPSSDARAPERTPVEPLARQTARDEQAVMRESISDAFDIGTLLETDDTLSYRASGIGVDVLRRLRRGEWQLQKEIDLHGLRRDEAKEALAAFLRSATLQGLRCVRIVHGKGLGSPGKTPVLKGKVQSWLIQRESVLAFVQAKPADGGAGALLVLLAPSA